jgi:hypothetical protein
MAAGLLQKLVFGLVAIMGGVLLLSFFLDIGPVGQAKSTTQAIIDSFDLSLGVEDLSNLDNSIVPEPHARQFLLLKSAVQKAKASSKRNCFVKYGGFTPLGEGGTVIGLTQEGSKTHFILSGDGGARRDTLLSYEMEGVKPCVVAGDGVPQKFYHNFFGAREPFIPGYFNLVSSIKIMNDGANEIDYGTGLKSFAGHEWVFTPDNQHICFFPTNSFGGNTDDGLLKDYFEDQEGAYAAMARVAANEELLC